MQVLDFFLVLSSKSYAPFTESPFPYHRLPNPAHVATAHRPPYRLTQPTAHAPHAPRETRASLTMRLAALGVFGTLARRVKQTQMKMYSAPSHFLQRTPPTYLVLAADQNSPHGVQSWPRQLTSQWLATRNVEYEPKNNQNGFRGSPCASGGTRCYAPT
jgi:hypothetical protein